MNSSYLNAAAGAFLAVVFVTMTVSIVSEGIYHSEAPEQAGFEIIAEESAGGGAAAPAEEELAPIAPLMASADPAAGENVFKKCAACHSVDPSGTNKVGPGLYNLIGRPIAAHEGFNYSAAMQEYAAAEGEWTYEHLNAFLHAPKKEVPGTAMGFVGLKKPEDIANVLAYLRQQADSPAPLPTPEEAAPEEAAPAGATEAEGASEATQPAEGDVTQPVENAQPPAAGTPPASPVPAAGAAPENGGEASGEETAPASEETTPSGETPADVGTVEDAGPAGGTQGQSPADAETIDRGQSTGE